ncbi:MAG TPA: helix-turn-helix transcriptional regulator [Anaerolineales bacterium]|nr:helix-turn-helix transcriptional regulator [Anaerolineales bacterium]
MSKTIYSEKYKKVLEQLRQARRDAGFTQTEVALALGKPQSFVAKCESGERRLDIIELSEFAVLYGKKIEYFLGG